MTSFFTAHWGDILVLLVLGAAVGLILGRMRKNRKRGCCGSCEGCSHCGSCHPQT